MNVSGIVTLFSLLVIGIFGLSSVTSLNTTYASLEIENSTDSTAIENYIPYSNSRLGISFEYPSDWKLTEKTSRFSSDADVEVSNGFNTFKFVDHKEAIDSGLEFADLEFLAETATNVLVKPPEDRLIEGVDMKSYQIDGKETATFLYTTEFSFGESSSFNLDYATQMFMVENDGKIYNLMYQDTVSKFDTPQSQEKMNHILNSFRFIDSDGSSEGEEENDNEDEDNN